MRIKIRRRWLASEWLFFSAARDRVDSAELERLAQELFFDEFSIIGAPPAQGVSRKQPIKPVQPLHIDEP
jgi:hypothetical protein